MYNIIYTIRNLPSMRTWDQADVSFKQIPQMIWAAQSAIVCNSCMSHLSMPRLLGVAMLPVVYITVSFLGGLSDWALTCSQAEHAGMLWNGPGAVASACPGLPSCYALLVFCCVVPLHVELVAGNIF